MVAYMKCVHHASYTTIRKFIRDIKYLTGLHDPETKAYGKKLLTAVKEMFKVIHNRECYSAENFTHALERAREAIMEAALNDVPSRLDKNGKELKREAFNMAKRFRTNGKAYFAFITTPGIGPTNNLAEQAVRFIVIDRLTSHRVRAAKKDEKPTNGYGRWSAPVHFRSVPPSSLSLRPSAPTFVANPHPPCYPP